MTSNSKKSLAGTKLSKRQRLTRTIKTHVAQHRPALLQRLENVADIIDVLNNARLRDSYLQERRLEIQRLIAPSSNLISLLQSPLLEASCKQSLIAICDIDHEPLDIFFQVLPHIPIENRRKFLHRNSPICHKVDDYLKLLELFLPEDRVIVALWHQPHGIALSQWSRCLNPLPAMSRLKLIEKHSVYPKNQAELIILLSLIPREQYPEFIDCWAKNPTAYLEELHITGFESLHQAMNEEGLSFDDFHGAYLASLAKQDVVLSREQLLNCSPQAFTRLITSLNKSQLTKDLIAHYLSSSAQKIAEFSVQQLGVLLPHCSNESLINILDARLDDLLQLDSFQDFLRNKVEHNYALNKLLMTKYCSSLLDIYFNLEEFLHELGELARFSLNESCVAYTSLTAQQQEKVNSALKTYLTKNRQIMASIDALDALIDVCYFAPAGSLKLMRYGLNQDNSFINTCNQLAGTAGHMMAQGILLAVAVTLSVCLCTIGALPMCLGYLLEQRQKTKKKQLSDSSMLHGVDHYKELSQFQKHLRLFNHPSAQDKSLTNEKALSRT